MNDISNTPNNQEQQTPATTNQEQERAHEQPEQESALLNTVSADKEGKAKKKKSTKKELIGWAITVVAAVLVAILVRSFVFIMVQVDGSSMLDTLHNQNRVFVWRAGYLFQAPQRGDVVICHYPDGNGNYDQSVNYVKRVIGLPGDTVSISAGDVYINGEKLNEPYLSPNRKSTKEKMDPITLGQDEYFVMGDNRVNSRDSRFASVGPIKREQIIGKAIWKLYPFNEIGTVE